MLYDLNPPKRKPTRFTTSHKSLLMQDDKSSPHPIHPNPLSKSGRAPTETATQHRDHPSPTGLCKCQTADQSLGSPPESETRISDPQSSPSLPHSVSGYA
ncbi:hypothetical protein BJY00DRAFT_294529 [Aspergillus carlsbadensis]|nr:hypothetical protein BJY00DRAFT_294529 [Aspergillus carlsbadensis]